MDDRISDLLGMVREEIALYRDIVEHARRKTALLVQGRVEAILESNKIEETFHLQFRALETQRSRLCEDLSQAFRIPREEFALIKLAEHLQQPLALEIRTQIVHLRNIAQQLKSVSNRNRKLIEKSLLYSKGMLAHISNASGSYQQSGMFETIPSIPPAFSQRA